MQVNVKAVTAALVASLVVLAPTACSFGGGEEVESVAQRGQAAEASAAGAEVTVSREEVESTLYEAASKPYTSVTFSTTTKTTASGGTSDSTTQGVTPTIKSSTVGELDISGEKPVAHTAFQSKSNLDYNDVSYEMFIDSERLIVQQGDDFYVEEMTEEMLGNYVTSVTNVLSQDEISRVLDLAGTYKVQRSDDETVVKVVADKDKVIESGMVDASSMPEGGKVRSLVVSYCIGSDGRFESVSVMSSTAGTPTYHFREMYTFSDYDETTLPEWPDLKSYIAEKSGVLKDDEGRMYIIGEDGLKYYVTEIGDDGMIYIDTGDAGTYGSSGSGSSSSDYSYYYYEGSDNATTDSNTENASGGGSESADDSDSVGRAYITADDGTVHYLDEEGSQLFENSDGTRYFIDADGNFYFLSE